MFVLKDLWYGNVAPSERAVRRGSHYQTLVHRQLEYAEQFEKGLTPDGKKAFRAYEETQNELQEISDFDAFYKGVCFGVRFMLDVIGNHQTDLPQIGECV